MIHRRQASASLRRPGEKSAAMIGPMPLIFSAAITTAAPTSTATFQVELRPPLSTASTAASATTTAKTLTMGSVTARSIE